MIRLRIEKSGETLDADPTWSITIKREMGRRPSWLRQDKFQSPGKTTHPGNDLPFKE